MQSKRLVLAIFTFLVFSVGSPASATVSLYLVDDPNETPTGTINVEATLFDLDTSDGISASIQYSFNGTDFDYFGNGLADVQISEKRRIDFQLELFDQSNTSIGYDTDGILSFPSMPEDIFYGLEAYSSATINWGDFRIEFLSSSSDDNFAAIPIPGAVLLFSTGIVAGIFKMRKSRNK